MPNDFKHTHDGHRHDGQDRHAEDIRAERYRNWPIDDDASADEIESNIRDTRHDMDHTLDELFHHLEPGQVVGRIWSAVQRELPGGGSSSDMLGNVGRSIGKSIKSHPVPTVMVGLGAAWLLSEQLSGRSLDTDTMSDAAEDAGHRVGRGGLGAAAGARDAAAHAGHAAGHAAHEAGHRIAGGAHAAAESVSHAGHEVASSTAHQARRAAHATSEAYQAHPLLFGLAAAAAGLAGGIAVPDTRAERRAFGTQAQRWRREAAEHAADAADEAIDTVGARVSGGVEAVGQQIEAKADQASEAAQADPQRGRSG